MSSSSTTLERDPNAQYITDEEYQRRVKIASFLKDYGAILSVIISFAVYYFVFRNGGIRTSSYVSNLLNMADQQQQQQYEKVLSLMILNGRIWTGERLESSGITNFKRTKNAQKYSIKWAEALAVHKSTGRIIAIGSNSEVLSRFSPSMAEHVLDFKKKKHRDDATGEENEVDVPLIIPGFIDAHVHVILGGKAMLGVQLRTVKNKQEFVEKIKDFMTVHKVKPGEWITGAEWSETTWQIEGGSKLPHKNWIDSFTAENPVYLTRMDGHSCLVNSKALALAGITKDTVIQGGSIDIDPVTGEPTGILRDKALEFVQKIIPPLDSEKAALIAMDEFLKNGITSVHDMGAVFNLGSWDQITTFTKLHHEKKLKVRIYATVELETHKKLTAHIHTNFKKPKSTHAALVDDFKCCWTESHGGRAGDSWLKIGGLKEFIDGSLGSRTAYMFEPFEGTVNNTGLLVIDPETFYQRVKEADSNYHQIIVHAIGDKAISLLLDVYERVIKESNDTTRDRRLRIEHAQQIREEDIERFKKLNIIASMQPIHLKDDALYAESVIGARAKQLYNVRKFLNKGVTVAMGTDWYVAELDPLNNIHAAVSRKPCLSPTHVERRNEPKNPKDCEPFLPEEHISIEESLIAYTQNSAYAAFSEKEQGTLKKGYLGDITILSRNILALDETDEQEVDSITTKTKIMMTIVGGKIMYENDDPSLSSLYVHKRA
ncbi:hypothetical protein C9374_010578 [Naegleria lovaniensis]|uniref:Amidohydrolase 3 domain-containing protein n=1 Tax=Naegleria lovaniensis TaxID=51637 RepID=A0AA88GFX3_NAELO|nr:uncharacterized protein C9374_010578 [Naegleria lovaniensis]KAG2374559.1 hypothetical protein C9374_010578 [Naegleria lovaniensis]